MIFSKPLCINFCFPHASSNIIEVYRLSDDGGRWRDRIGGLVKVVTFFSSGLADGGGRGAGEKLERKKGLSLCRDML